jgi:hypothetical protein
LRSLASYRLNSDRAPERLAVPVQVAEQVFRHV